MMNGHSVNVAGLYIGNGAAGCGDRLLVFQADKPELRPEHSYQERGQGRHPKASTSIHTHEHPQNIQNTTLEGADEDRETHSLRRSEKLHLVHLNVGNAHATLGERRQGTTHESGD